MEKNKKICPNCGKELTSSARKCKYCNTQLAINKAQLKENFSNLFVLFCLTALIIGIILIVSRIDLSLFNLHIDFKAFYHQHIDVFMYGTILLILSSIIGAILGNKIFKCLLIFLVILFGTLWAAQNLLKILLVFAFSILFIFALGNNKTQNVSSEDEEDFRKGKMGKYGAFEKAAYVIIRYKSSNPNNTKQLFYEFKAKAPLVKDAPENIYIKGNVATSAQYFEYQIISEHEYLMSKLPEGDYGYYNR